MMITELNTKERVILVYSVSESLEETESTVLEFTLLAKSAGAIPVATLTHRRLVPDPKYYVGKGKAEEIRAIVQAESLDLALFNHALSPSQKRNLEALLKCRVLDRTELILDIFAQRARSFEGKLQVSLAQLRYLSTRLIRGWTHLERQRGGIGLRGPGETQLETDRRLIRQHIKVLQYKLQKVRQQRQQSRQYRQQSLIPVVALVGYTNAGKSTLFSRLTHADTEIADQLFATLDPLLRQVYLPNGQKIILADTVGFIRQLPHELVEAFSATLEEVREADLLLHVVDASQSNLLNQIESVQTVLKEIEAQSIPQLLVYNKIDCLHGGLMPQENIINKELSMLAVSAKMGYGIDQLHKAIIAKINSPQREKQFNLDNFKKREG